MKYITEGKSSIWKQYLPLMEKKIGKRKRESFRLKKIAWIVNTFGINPRCYNL